MIVTFRSLYGIYRRYRTHGIGDKLWRWIDADGIIYGATPLPFVYVIYILLSTARERSRDDDYSVGALKFNHHHRHYESPQDRLIDSICHFGFGRIFREIA